MGNNEGVNSYSFIREVTFLTAGEVQIIASVGNVQDTATVTVNLDTDRDGISDDLDSDDDGDGLLEIKSIEDLNGIRDNPTVSTTNCHFE